jgi:hypothetical protein
MSKPQTQQPVTVPTTQTVETPPASGKKAKPGPKPGSKSLNVAKKIESLMAREMIVYQTAIRIREILDEAAKTFGADKWKDGNKEAEVLRLATESK